MQALVLVSVFLTQTPNPTQTQTPAPVDVSAVKTKLRALSDGHGHYIVYNSENPTGEMLFSGDAKRLYQSRVIGGGRSGDESWQVSFWDPRVPFSAARPDVAMRDEGKLYELTCGKRTAKLSSLPDAELEQLLDTAVLLPPPWTRRPEKLMRDDAGNYFFVDRLRTEDSQDRRDFRVFKGPRGKMKQLPLKDIVDDSEGSIFATRDGTLRLISAAGTKKQTFKWIVGKKETILTEVPVEDNARMIYIDLGPYSGLALGTPCDWLL